MEMTVPCIFATVPVLVMSEGEGDDGDGDGESEGTPPKYMRDVGNGTHALVQHATSSHGVAIRDSFRDSNPIKRNHSNWESQSNLKTLKRILSPGNAAL